MDTGHYAEQDPEPVVKVELNKKRIENTIVKFRYYIRITNEGEIEGYAKEISDYIPEGLKFNEDVTIKGKYDGEPITWTNFMDNTSGTGTFYSTYIYASSPESATSGTTFVRNGIHYKPGFESSVYLDEH